MTFFFFFFFFFLLFFFFTFKNLRDQYNHDVERKVDSFQNKIFVNEDIQKSYFKTEQISYLYLSTGRSKPRCLRAYYLGDSFYLECHNKY